jgi:hypothetical protein
MGSKLTLLWVDFALGWAKKRHWESSWRKRKRKACLQLWMEVDSGRDVINKAYLAVGWANKKHRKSCRMKRKRKACLEWWMEVNSGYWARMMVS